MKSNFKSVIRLLVFLLVLAASGNHAAAFQCGGRFTNPITDVCWTCIFPISIGASPVAEFGQEDNDTNPPSPVCLTCSVPPWPGLSFGFWEPARQIDVTRTPYCFPALGGVSLTVGQGAPQGVVESNDHTGGNASFYHSHWYVNPLMFLLEGLVPSSCIEKKGFDIAYMTELDPIWNDDELTLIINPDGFLFNNPIAQAVCAADCAKANFGFPFRQLFWCSGCNGSMYPLNGHVQSHIGGVQASTLIAERMIVKMQRQLISWRGSGPAGFCGYYPDPVADKTDYKIEMTFPIPQDSVTGMGKCCQPIGRSSTLWGVGREFPYAGEDFNFFMFRKRNCCLGPS